MATTLGILYEQIQRRYHGGDVPSEGGIAWEDIRLMVSDISSYLTRMSLYENMQLEGIRTVDSMFIAVFEDVAVQYNEARDKYYTELPARPVNLPGGMGVFQVSPMQDERMSFIPLLSGAAALMLGSDWLRLEGWVGFVMEGRRIYYHNFEKHKRNVKTVLVKMVGSLEDYDDDMELPISPDLQSRIIDECLMRLQGKLPLQDKRNDQQAEVK